MPNICSLFHGVKVRVSPQDPPYAASDDKTVAKAVSVFDLPTGDGGVIITEEQHV
jgi:hypothetical protein